MVKLGGRVLSSVAFVMLEPSAAKVACPVLRGEGSRKTPDLPGCRTPREESILNIREIAKNNSNYYEINREERNYAAILFAALCKLKFRAFCALVYKS